MQKKLFTALKSFKVALKYAKNDQVQKDVKNGSKFDFRMEPKFTTLLPTCF